MKLFSGILYFLIALFISTNPVADDAIAAIKAGKSADLAKLLDEKVNIKLINQEDVLSKQQAEANIKYFFEKHTVKNFTNTHVSNSNQTVQYLTGNLETSNGKFRVSILIRRNLIAQFRIEVDNDE
jgi:Domain of unknown function (DUF4783)